MAKTKHNSNGRDRKRTARFFQLHHWFLDSPAWKSMSVYSRCLYLELKQRYNGSNNGGISLSHREAQRLLGCSNTPIPAAFRQLQEAGFIKPQQRGAFKGVPMATTWLLSELPQDLPVRSLVPTKDFMSWKPLQKKPRYALSGLPVRSKRTDEGDTVRSKRTDSTSRAYGEPPISPFHSTLRAGTCNIPYPSDGGAEAQPVGVIAAQLLNAARERPAKSKAGALRGRDGGRCHDGIHHPLSS